MASRRSSRSSHEWCPPARPPSTWTITGMCGTSAAIRTTWRIWETVPGLKLTCRSPASVSSSMSATDSSSSGMPAVTITPSKAIPAARARCTSRLPPTCIFHRYGSRKRELNCAERPGSSSSVRRSVFSAKMSSETWPPPASSAQCPALAAAATISGSTVVGVMPASRIGEVPVRRVNEVSTWTLPSGREISCGWYAVHGRSTIGAAPGVKRLRSPPRVAAATTPTPWPRRTDRLRRVRASPGPMSRSHSAPECRAWAISSTQSTGSTRTRRASEAARSASSPQRAAQSRTMSTAGAIAGWWKPTSTSSGSKTGAKTSPPVSLASRRRRDSDSSSAQWRRSSSRSSGRPTTTWRRWAFRMDTAGRNAGSASENSWSTVASSASPSMSDTPTIGLSAPRRNSPVRRPTSVAAAPMSSPTASSRSSIEPKVSTDSTASTPCECPTTDAGTVVLTSSPSAASARVAPIWASSTAGSETAAADREASSGRSLPSSSPVVVLAHSMGRKPWVRTTAISSWTGSVIATEASTSRWSSGPIPVPSMRSLSASRQAIPWPPKARANAASSRRSSASERAGREAAANPVSYGRGDRSRSSIVT